MERSAGVRKLFRMAKRWPRNWAWRSKNRRPAAVRTETSPRLWACRRWTAWARSAKARTRSNESILINRIADRTALLAKLVAAIVADILKVKIMRRTRWLFPRRHSRESWPGSAQLISSAKRFSDRRRPRRAEAARSRISTPAPRSGHYTESSNGNRPAHLRSLPAKNAARTKSLRLIATGRRRAAPVPQGRHQVRPGAEREGAVRCNRQDALLRWRSRYHHGRAGRTGRRMAES